MSFFHLYLMYKRRINVKLFFIFKKLPFQNNNLVKAMKDSTLLGGKRLRACLVYTTGKLFKINIITLDTIASAIECIHSYSLIHDDLPCMDNDNFRRGKSSCHIKYGDSTALISGDALQSLAFNILSTSSMPRVSNLQRIRMISELSSSIGVSGMCIGQVLDLTLKAKNIKLSELEKINLYKTAFLIRSSIRLVYFSSRYTSKIILSILDHFSISIGLAFQMQDDIFDAKNDCVKIKINNNIRMKKYTYVSIIGLCKTKKMMTKLYREALRDLENLKNRKLNVDILKKLVKYIIQRTQ